ncbi:MAG: nucleoside hydrolase [Bacteroidota bacterium]
MYKNTLLLSLILLPFLLSAQSTKIILDADTGNEVDDPYAIVRALIEPSLEVVALNATQWQASHWTVEHSMEESYRLNQLILGYLKMADKVKSYRGGVNRLYDWGDIAQYSAAAYHIIQQAKQMPDEQKIPIVTLGALTNVASALLIEPSIAPRIKVYWLGTTYDFDKNILKRQDFNCVMDVQALDVMLQSDVEMHIIPVSVANQMTFDYAETAKRLKGQHPILDFLVQRWDNHLDGGRHERTIWDLAIVQALIHPEWATEVQIKSAPADGQRNLYYYKDIDEDKMREDFFTSCLEYFKK